ncbi:MAG: hypothetical protein ACI4V7_07525 [Succinivibrionaceae bacterium]
MEKSVRYLEGISFARVKERFNDYLQCKEELKDNTRMLYCLVKNTGQIDVLLIPHNKEFASRTKHWERLPVNIDRTIDNVFKKLIYKKSKADDLAELIRANIQFHEDRVAQQLYNQTVNDAREEHRRNLEMQLENPGTVGIYNDNDELIDVVYSEEYAEYLEAHKNFQRLGYSHIELLRRKQLEYSIEEGSMYRPDFSHEQNQYISKELSQGSKFWHKFLKKTSLNQMYCKECGMPIDDCERHVCDTYDIPTKVERIFTKLSLKHFVQPKMFGVKRYDILRNEILGNKVTEITIPENYEIPEYKKEILAMNDIRRDNYNPEENFNIV